jgi:hypothetical protein
MKKIEAFIRTSKFEEVKFRLEQIRRDFFSLQNLSEAEYVFLFSHLNQQGMDNNTILMQIDYSLLVN